jgi:Tfp pilus assembly protein PilO
MPVASGHRELPALGWALHAAGLAGTLVLLALAGWFVAAPLDAQRADYESRTHKLDRLSTGRPRVERLHRELAAELDAVQQRKAELRRRITDGTREGEFLRQVSEAAARVGLRLVSYQPGTVSKGGTYGTMQIQLVCDGRYEGICRFLQQLDELPRLSTVERMEVSAPARGDVYSFQLTLDIYFASSATVARAPRKTEAPRG